MEEKESRGGDEVLYQVYLKLKMVHTVKGSAIYLSNYT